MNAVNLNQIVKDIMEKYVFPAIDAKVAAWHTPFEFDDKVWAFIKAKILEELSITNLTVTAG